MRSRGNDRDAYTLIAGKLAIINACTISRSVFPKFVLTSDSSQSNLGTTLHPFSCLLNCVVRAARLFWVYIRGVKLRLRHSKAS